MVGVLMIIWRHKALLEGLLDNALHTTKISLQEKPIMRPFQADAVMDSRQLVLQGLLYGGGCLLA